MLRLQADSRETNKGLESRADTWRRTDQLFDHGELRKVNTPEEWSWYQAYVVDFMRYELGLAKEFSEEQIHR